MTQFPKPKKSLWHIFRKRRRGARSYQLRKMWWSLRIYLQWLGCQQSHITFKCKCQWIINSVRHLIRIKTMGKQLAKVGLMILLLVCANFSLTIYLTFYLFSFILHLLQVYVSDSCERQSKSKVCRREQLEANFVSSQICGRYFSCLKAKKNGCWNTPSLLST